MAPEPKNYLFEEVSKHRTTKDCWLIIDGKVYDVSEFMEDHPGGDEVLIAASGKDATNDFEDVGHSNDAREQMNQFLIGEIDPATVPLNRYVAAKPYKGVNSSDLVIKILQFLVPLMILGLVFAVRYWTKTD